MDKEQLETIIEKAEEIGASLSEKAIEGVEFIYPLAYRRVFILGMFSIIVGAVSLYFSIRLGKSGRKVLREGCDEEGGIIRIYFSVLIICAISLPLLYHGLMRVFVTDWYAIRELISLLN